MIAVSNLMQFLLDPERLKDFVDQREMLMYLLLFVVVFCETGLVVTPFLPGDTLLFAAGTFANENVLELKYLLPILCAAAILGDTMNYWIGRWVGPKVFHKDNARFLNKEQLHRAHAFYEKNGGKTVSIARFIPVIRAFAPFVAGVGSMNYWRFLFFSTIGTLAWVNLFVLLGHFLAKVHCVKHYFGLVSAAIIVVCCVLIISGIIRQVRATRLVADNED